MKNKKNILITISIILIVSLSLAPDLKSIKLAHAQGPLCDNGVVTHTTASNALPVILLHGYKENSNIWSIWENLLYQNNIPYCTVSFQQSIDPLSDYDACGSAADHAQDLAKIVQYVRQVTGQDKVNIVGHSKGGLDARVYLAQSNTPDVANLIMIGTPNAGGLLADFNYFDTCTPAAWDLTSNAPDTEAVPNTHTNYYTIAGVCSLWPVPNDVFVAESSVDSLSYAKVLLPHPTDCHWNLLHNEEFGLALPYLLAR
jgi:pimeloyl-ACP methyl ester carboxylesterase